MAATSTRRRRMAHAHRQGYAHLYSPLDQRGLAQPLPDPPGTAPFLVCHHRHRPGGLCLPRIEAKPEVIRCLAVSRVFARDPRATRYPVTFSLALRIPCEPEGHSRSRGPGRESLASVER